METEFLFIELLQQCLGMCSFPDTCGQKFPQALANTDSGRNGGVTVQNLKGHVENKNTLNVDATAI